jgi:hypothetical protein
MATETGVIPALMDALVAAREDADKELRHLRALTATSERQLRRYEGKEHFPPGADIDRLVSVYSEATGISVFDLWDEAIKRAREASERAGGVPDPHALERAAREGRHADQQRRAEGDRAKQKKTAGG